MKNLLLALAAISMFVSCGPSAEQVKLESTKDSLMVEVKAKDSIINEAFINISEIATTLSQITERERIVTKQAAGEITKTTKEQIADNISQISDLLERNRQTIARLQASTSKLKAANVQIDGLQKLVASLEEQLAAKDVQLGQLAEQIRALNIEVKSLSSSVANLQQDKSKLETTVADQTQQINTVYYIVGEEKSLKEQNIIDKKGFIGRTIKQGSNNDMTAFTKGDLRNIDRIPVNGKKATLVSSHPENSYMMVMGNKNFVEELVITDKNEFWKNSKILIISYK